MRHCLFAAALAISGCGGSDGSSPASTSPSVDPGLRAQVEAATGWTFKTPPVFVTITREELLRKLDSKLQGEPGLRTAAAGRALQVLGVLPVNYDLVSNFKKLYAEELLALYDPKERTVFLVKEALQEALSHEDLRLQKMGKPTTRDIVIAHEMVHALQHQHDPLFELLEDSSADLDDVRTALHGLAEGEATIQMYALLGPPDPERIVRGMEQETSSKHQDQPAYVRQSLYFPYLWGTRFVGDRTAGKSAGSAARLHAAPPLSTEHLFHRERPPQEDPPVAVFLPDLSSLVGADRTLSYEGVLGEADLGFVFSAGSPSTMGGFPGGWGGDRLQLYEKDGRVPVAVLVVRFDRPVDAWVAFAQLSSESPAKETRAVAWNGQDIALVVGLARDEGARVAREALGRLQAWPIATPAEIRKRRTEARFPAAAPADVGDLARNLEGLAAGVKGRDPFSGAFNRVVRLSPRLAWLGAARYNLSRPEADRFAFGLGRESAGVSIPPEELDLIIRGGGTIDVNSPINGALGEMLENYGRGWRPGVVHAIVQWHSLQRKAQFPDFVRKNALVPGVARAALSLSYRDAPLHEAFLKPIEEGLLNPMDTRSMDWNAAIRARLVEAHLTALLNGRIEWTDQFKNVFENSLRSPEGITLTPVLIEKWSVLPLTAKGRGYLLGRSFKDPQSWKGSIPLAKGDLEKGDVAMWQGFAEVFRPKEVARQLPHFKELLETFESLAKEPVVPGPLLQLVTELRR